MEVLCDIRVKGGLRLHEQRRGREAARGRVVHGPHAVAVAQPELAEAAVARRDAARRREAQQRGVADDDVMCVAHFVCEHRKLEPQGVWRQREHLRAAHALAGRERLRQSQGRAALSTVNTLSGGNRW